jgi:hypothetical protein
VRCIRAFALFVGLAVAVAGCADVTRRGPSLIAGGSGASGTTESDLHAALGGWAASFASIVGATTDRIRAESRDRHVRRNALFWQLRMIPLARLAAFRPDPQAAYIASLALASAQQTYLASGDGSALFGEQQPIAVAAATELEQSVVDLGHSFLNDHQLHRLQKQVDDLVAQRPIRGTFAADALAQGFADPALKRGFGWVVDLPMTPFRALTGVSDTAQAVNNFNQTAREFTEAVSELPQLSRWQLELLLYDAEELESVERALAAAEGLSTAAGELPEQLGAQVSARIHAARATIAELDAALARAESLSGPLTHVADRVGDASAQWTALLAEMRADRGERSGRPFDVREYESAAARIDGASRGVRELVAELNQLDASGARALLDRAAVCAALLIGFFFASLVAYRLLVRRLG